MNIRLQITLIELCMILKANFRSGHRLPALCWANSQMGTSLWRSSQPKAGVSGSCQQDEKMLDAIAATSCASVIVGLPVPISSKAVSSSRISASFPSPFAASSSSSSSSSSSLTPSNTLPSVGIAAPILHIADLRSRASAMANRAAGAGYESQANYPNARLEFFNIPNIHVMRDSLKSLSSVLLNPSAVQANDIHFSKQIEDSQWLSHLRLVIKVSKDLSITLRSRK